jgi:hypothetical protein
MFEEIPLFVGNTQQLASFWGERVIFLLPGK